VAAGQALTSGMGDKADVDRALKRLIDIGAIKRVGRGDYRILKGFLERRPLAQAAV
jgi:hypothetical protein